MRIEKEETIALAIDFQEKLIPAISHHVELMDRAHRFLAGLRLLGVPVVITQQYTAGLGMSPQTVFEAAGTDGYVDKLSFSAYESVKEQIAGKRFVLICGMEAHCCVLQTLTDIAAAGYVPVLVTDCIGSRRDRDLDMAIRRAEQEGAILTTYEAALFELLKVAGTDVSRKIIRLVK